MDFWKPDPAKFQPDPVFHEVLVTWPWQDQGEMLNDLSGNVGLILICLTLFDSY